ncbi:MAG: HD domain-containing protein, partial [bacterium]
MRWLQARQPSAFQDLPADVQALVAQMREYFPKADLDVIREAYLFAEAAHKQQTRASGEPYITHPLAVATALVELRLDPVTIAAALLHDTAEDT